MADNYKIFSFLQGLFIILCSISVLDFSLEITFALGTNPEDFGFNDALFDEDGSVWWSEIMFWGYCFLIVGIFQLIKAFTHEDRDVERYKIFTLLQSILITLVGLSLMDFALYIEAEGNDFGIVDGIFDPQSDNAWWNILVFWGYCIILVGVFHFLKLSQPRIFSLIQAILILLAGIFILDLHLGADDDFGINENLFDGSESGLWGPYTFWAYCFLVVAITQFIKAMQD